MYALGRIWDSAIGLSVGMLINVLVFPYDNSKKIRAAVRNLDAELILFLEDIFDGDNHLPDADIMEKKLSLLLLFVYVPLHIMGKSKYRPNPKEFKCLPNRNKTISPKSAI